MQPDLLRAPCFDQLSFVEAEGGLVDPTVLNSFQQQAGVGSGRQVILEKAILDHERIGFTQVDHAALLIHLDRMVGESYVAQGQPVAVLQPECRTGAFVGGSTGIDLPLYDPEAVEDDPVVDALAAEQVVGVVVRFPQYADIAAEDGFVLLPVALNGFGFHPGKAAEERQSFVEHKGGRTVGRSGGEIGAFRDPDRIAGCSRSQGVVQVGKGIGPTAAVVGAHGGGVDVNAVTAQ